MKKFYMIAINAKYIHSGLAVRELCFFADNDKHHQIYLAEFTINQTQNYILDQLFLSSPDVLLFSCYIWNIAIIQQLCPELKKLLPDCAIVLGGPEVSFDSEAVLHNFPAVDLIIRGEGEKAFTALLQALDSENTNLHLVPGITFRENAKYISTQTAQALDLALLPFPYPDLDACSNQILYYESSRGCPYRCAYCLSSVEKALRFAPLPKVFSDLQRFLVARVRQVKFVDRTFNCSNRHAMEIWSYLAEHDNGITNFHFELTADLVNDEMITFLRNMRPGLFQFEIGIQSTNQHTIRAINRNTNFNKASEIIRKLLLPGNIHIHLDLIAGLPYEDYVSFSRSFHDVFLLHPQQLQLGFLKLLKGSPLAMQATEFGLIAQDTPPYEVLLTLWLSHHDIIRLKHVEQMVELYYNSARFLYSLDYVLSLCASPFAMFEALSEFWVANAFHQRQLGNRELCDVLFAFSKALPGFEKRRFFWLLKLDLCLHEKPKKLPGWLDADNNQQHREKILSFYRSVDNIQRYLPQYIGLDHRQIYRLAHIEVFGDTPAEQRTILFDYGKRDIFGNAVFHEILL